MNSFKTLCVYFVFVVTLIAPRAPLFAASPAERPQEGRLLFLIETSAATDNDRVTIRKSIRSIIESGLDGHMHYGDTIGLWTYGDKVNTAFPMVLWTHEHQQDAEGAIDYWMMKQKFKGRADFSKVLAPLQRVINTSEKLTIVWYSSGDGQITGTPFDKEIAELHKEFRKDFRKQHIPFVTILAVRKGAVVDFTVNPGDAKLRLPDVFAKEDAAAAAAATAAAKVPPPQPAPPPVKKPPLIIHVGPSPELLAQKKTNAPVPTAVAAPTNSVATNVTAQKLTTNAVSVAQPTVQSNAPAPVSAAKPSVAAPTQTNAVATTNTSVASTSNAAVAAGKSNAPPLAAVAPTNKHGNDTAKSTPVVEKLKPAETKAAPAPAPAPAATATVAPAPHYTLIAIGCAVLAVIAGVIFFFVKKSTVPKGPSFISQSMTRERLNPDASKPSSDKPAGPE